MVQASGQLDEYTLIRKLGEGLTSEVYLATNPDGEQVALKILDRSNPNCSANALNYLMQEVRATQHLVHENVARCLAYREQAELQLPNRDPRNVAYIVQELNNGGELFDYISLTGHFEEPICRFYFKQLLEAIHYMHTHGITHRDLKPENLMLDANYNLKVIDFGFAIAS